MALQDWYCHNDGTQVRVDTTQPPPSLCPTCGQGSWGTEPTSKATYPGSTSKYPVTGRWSSSGGKHA